MKKVLNLLALICAATLLMTGCTIMKPYENMEEFIRSDDMQARIKEVNAASDPDVYRTEITGKGNQMICRFIYLKEIDREKALKEISDSMAKTEDSYRNMAKAASFVVNEKDPSVVVGYYTKDGEELYREEFHGE